ncbi:uncharacterized protein LOC135693488 isoform X2 [Rhopilema esculentum]|uniref:uncharacterized protein LOC135693488 isoform X2 n=1 Tax=Rhopilema esculentum TaxID=499914 RepID=UPI0031DFF9F6
MTWESTDDQTISLGYGKSNKVTLPENYHKDFFKEKHLINELSLVEDEKFICSLTQLENLVGCISCDICGQKRKVKKHGFIGSVAEVWLECENKHAMKWSSSETVNGVYAINLQLLSSIILSGNLYVKVSLLAKLLNLKIPSDVSFYRIAKHYVNPTVDEWWEEMQSLIFRLFAGKEVTLGGDGRNDSPGHCATYCTYSFIDTVSDLIVHQEIVDVRDANMKSPNMEKLGCKKGLDKLQKNMKVRGFVTDDHSQISAMLKNDNSFTEIKFQKDVWHKSAKLTKKLVQDKWLSLLKHLCNMHYQCNHGCLDTTGRADWFSATDSDFQQIRGIILDKKFLNSLKFYTDFRHTGQLEVFHNHLLMYCPKRVFFNYPAYKVRNRLALIDHNHHCNRLQARNENGDLLYSRRWSKKAGRWIPTITKEPKDYSYVSRLLAAVMNKRRNDSGKVERHKPLSEEDPRWKSRTIVKLPARATDVLVDEKNRDSPNKNKKTFCT